MTKINLDMFKTPSDKIIVAGVLGFNDCCNDN